MSLLGSDPICEVLVMTAKEYLRKVYKLEEYIWSLIEQRERVIDQQSKITSIVTGMPAAQSGGDKISNSTAALIDLQNRIEETLAEQRELKSEVLKKINGLDETEYKTILLHRYINFKNWFEICRVMGYSNRGVLYKHSEALKAFNVKYSDL